MAHSVEELAAAVEYLKRLDVADADREVHRMILQDTTVEWRLAQGRVKRGTKASERMSKPRKACDGCGSKAALVSQSGGKLYCEKCRKMLGLPFVQSMS